ncbi:OTU-domain-containing protein [Multifurca ochricompacta]|uniref:Ubiquitin thioesterase OTU n=1 Tax=Multifurca ochricompacta TaxID=376703 RepID=A0AAD4MAJ5_9AGAM|nr:OTU-domain-containing protein [Multifurca ochricompacta]
MALFRLRHPKGVSTLELDIETAKVQDLLQAILSISGIPPSAQDLKVGYPPRSLTAVIPELPLSSLGVAPGDQLIVVRKSGSAAPPSVTPTAPPSSANPRATLVNSPASSLSRPPPNPRPAAPAFSTPQRDGPDFIEMGGGYLVHRIVPDDNSCMFASVALVFEQDMQMAPVIRQTVAEAIQRDPETWSDAVLGHPREEYIHRILSPNSWGGAIELTILAAHYGAEIASVDVETGRIDRFGPHDSEVENRALLIYSGVHYDAAVLAPAPDAPQEFCASLVPAVGAEGDRILDALQALATKLREKHAYTNMATFDLRCEVCGKGIKGEKEARAHASETGHIKFGEF